LLACTSVDDGREKNGAQEDSTEVGDSKQPAAGDKKEHENESSAGEEEEEEEEEEKELVYALTSTDLNFDPLHAYTALESQVYTALYEGLVTYNPVNLEPVPGAASHWDKSEDGKKYRFYLREDATYSNGDQVTADDFRRSWLRILDPDAGAEYSTFFDIIKGARDYRMGKTDDPSEFGVTVVSDSVLDIELESPAAHFLKVLCHMSFVPVHPHYANEPDWHTRSSIMGNGPFYILEKSDNEIVFLKNNLYWDKKRVRIDRLVMRLFDQPGEISVEFNNGRIHWATNWDSNFLKDSSKIVFNPMFATSFLFFKCVAPPWNDGRVRRALALLVPWEQIRSEQVFYPTFRIVPEVPEYPDVKGIERSNQAEAFELLAEAGFERGRGLPPIIFRIPEGEDSKRIADIMAGAWEEALGVEVEQEVVDFRRYFSSLKKADYVIGRMTWIGDFADPLTFLQMWTEDSNLNDAGFSDEEYDQLIGKAIAEEGKARYELFSEAEAILLGNAVVMPISNQPTVNLIDLQRIKGWYPNPLDIHPFKYLYFKEARMLPNLVRWSVP
jgi:peptide/nickel transport system substrate-binding protein/oligopeptide transport system substrate-binding protein